MYGRTPCTCTVYGPMRMHRAAARQGARARHTLAYPMYIGYPRSSMRTRRATRDAPGRPDGGGCTASIDTTIDKWLPFQTSRTICTGGQGGTAGMPPLKKFAQVGGVGSLSRRLPFASPGSTQ